MIVYVHNTCSTCKEAISFLKQKGIAFEAVDIVKCPPSKEQIFQMLKYVDGDLKKLCNTSGMLYREGGYKDKLPSLTQEEVAELLSKEGMLVKRPFVLGADFGLLGFKKDAWEKTLC